MDDSKVQRLGSDYDTGWEETKRRCQTYKFQPVILCYEAVATGGSGGGGGGGGGGGLHDADEGGHGAPDPSTSAGLGEDCGSGRKVALILVLCINVRGGL